jgi:tRNA modification GTPase
MPTNSNQELFSEIACAVVTPLGRGAVATVRVVGTGAWELIQTCFDSRYSERTIPPRRIVVGCWLAGGLAEESSPRAVGEEVVVAKVDEQTIDVHCHGGTSAVEAVMSSLESRGCRRVAWHESMAQGYEGEIECEALVALSRAVTEVAASHLLAQYHGALADELKECSRLLKQRHWDLARERLAKLHGTAAAGKHLVDPFRIAVCGPPNVGKSSLINAFAGFQRSIVFDQPGTTRDVLSVNTAIQGWPVQLLDTAGLREADESTDDGRIESVGIQKALAAAQQADLVILVSSWDQPWSQLVAWYERFPQSLLVHNKSDLVSEPDDRPAGISVSAKVGLDWDLLLSAIFQRLLPVPPVVGSPVLFAERQIAFVKGALKALEEERFDDLQPLFRWLR